MQVNVEPSADGSFVCLQVEGTATDEKVLAFLREHYAKAATDRAMNELTDLSRGDFSKLTPAGLQSLAAEVENVLEVSGARRIRTAIYAPEDLSYGLSRMYEALAQTSPENVRVFRDRDAAIRWLTE